MAVPISPCPADPLALMTPTVWRPGSVNAVTIPMVIIPATKICNTCPALTVFLLRGCPIAERLFSAVVVPYVVHLLAQVVPGWELFP